MTFAVDPRLVRRAGSVFSSATIRQVMNGTSPQRAETVLSSLVSEKLVGQGASRADVITALDVILRKSYRTEHVYKAAIVEKLLLGRHNLRTATILSEFTVGNSCVDTVVINGEGIAYEIKTELDSSVKLYKQLADYRRAFRKINVLVHESMTDSYLDLLTGSDVGLMALTSRRTLSVKKKPVSNTEELDVTTMMKALRKHEYTNILERHFGESPCVPASRYFRECLLLSQTIEPLTYQRYFEDALKARTPREPDLALSTPCESLRYVYLQLDPARSQYERIDRWLRGAADPCTIPTSAESSLNS